MATQTVAPQQTTAAPEALDQDIVNLAKAIRSVETRGQKDPYTAKGGSGEFGAYQYTEDTWNADVKALTGKAVPLTQADKILQNEVAYKKLESLKKQGYNPGQIASIWNSGGPEWEGKVGVNKYGIKYDVPKYVDAVATAYQGFKAGSQNPLIKTSPSTVGEEERVTPEQQADAASAEQYGAFFPAVTGESRTGAALRTAGNLPGSAFNFAKGAVGMINPVNTVNTASQIPGAFSGLTKESGGVLPALAATAKEIPHTAYEMLIPEAIRAGISALGGFTKNPGEILPTLGNMIPGVNIPQGYNAEIDKPLQQAERTMVNDPFGQVAPAVLLARTAAGAVDTITGKVADTKMSNYVKNIDENTAAGKPIPTGTGTNFGGAMDSAISKTAQAVEAPIKYAFGKAKETVRPSASPTDVAGKILQGTEQEAATGAKVLARTNLEGVKTYTDLSKKLDESIKSDLSKVDAEYATSKTKTKLADLKREVTSESGGASAKASINYVQEALRNLQELYFKTKDPASEARIKALTAQAKRQGLTADDINKIAREYGTEFGSKAFSARTGDPLTSVNAQAFENIRTGLKDTARGFLESDEAKALDKGVSETLRVKKLVDTMAEKVNKLEQRVVKRNIVEKVARGVGIAVDVLTAGALKAFVQKLFFPSNVGLKTLNSLDLEGQLSGNINTLKRLEGADDAATANFFIQAMRTINRLPETPVPYVFGKKQEQLTQ